MGISYDESKKLRLVNDGSRNVEAPIVVANSEVDNISIWKEEQRLFSASDHLWQELGSFSKDIFGVQV